MKNVLLSLPLFVCALPAAAREVAHDTSTPNSASAPSRAELRAAITASPLRFVPCTADSAYTFASQGLDYGVFLDGPDAAVVLRGAGEEPVTLRFTLRGASEDTLVTPELPLAGVSNVYRGTDAQTWRAGVPQFGRVRCAQVYSGIDLLYYGNQERLEYDFIVAPGADPRVITFELGGARALRVDARGDLVVETSAGDFVQHAPIAYQDIGDVRLPVAAAYEIDGTSVSFRLGAYDTQHTLVVDPVVTFSTFLGGSGADQAWDFDVDPAGNICVAGYTASANFPRTVPGTLNGFWDMFVAKFDPTGSTLIYSTFLSATGFSTSITEYATGIACDAAGNAYVTGRTNATDFPVLNARQPANAGNTDAVVLELDPAGQLVFSTYHGGSADENGRYDSIFRCGKIAVDADGFVYVTGSSSSPNFPLSTPIDGVVSGASCAGGCSDVFLTKFTPDGQSLVYSTFLGDTLPESPIGIVVDAQGAVYLGANDGSILLTKIAADGQSVLYTRSIQNGSDGGHSTLNAFDVDAFGRLALTGVTTSGAFPTTPGTWQPSYTGCFSGTCEEAFVMVLAPDNGPILASTYIGTPTYNDSGTAIRFDHNGDVVVALRARRDSGIWYGDLWKFDPTLTLQLAQLQICGRGETTDIFVDALNNVRVVGWVWSAPPPMPTAGAFQVTHGGNIDVFVSGYDMRIPPALSQIFCTGDGAVGVCPCGNQGALNHGCANSAFATGAALVATGVTSVSADSTRFDASNLTGPLCVFYQGPATQTPVPFDDGLHCVTGMLVRLRNKPVSAAATSYPGSGDLSISVRGAVPAAGGTYYYQAVYRNSVATFCTPATSNRTNAVALTWVP